MISPTDYLKLVLNPIRLAVLGRAAVGAVDTAELATELGIPERRVLEAVGRLRDAGLLDERFRLRRPALREVATRLPRAEPPSDSVVEGEWSAAEAEVLSRFFSGSRLTEIPAQRSKRLVVLERLAMEFEPGLRYSERSVNTTLQTFHPDYASLRRYLVDEGLLARADGAYWRSGGRVDLPEAG
ncbi:MAG: DUF2087 domain-containing protein [Acidimicrobiia bacterium]